MKKVYSILTALVMCCLFATEKANAQNLQVQYDLSRGYWTTTTEMFRPDSFGSTYFFVDLDLNPRMTGAYWEISRELNFWQDTFGLASRSTKKYVLPNESGRNISIVEVTHPLSVS